ncbi:hypothetical protein [Streptomyces sp. cg36]|uniref:hypothetical protein n=1 Tax=Streptomyces sp. cg36 TaxID=3238798 RepID=UPI0034E1F800
MSYSHTTPSWAEWIAARAAVKCHCGEPRADRCRALWCASCPCHAPLAESVFGSPKTLSVEIQHRQDGAWAPEYYLTDIASFVGSEELGTAMLQEWVARAGTQEYEDFRAVVADGVGWKVVTLAPDSARG